MDGKILARKGSKERYFTEKQWNLLPPAKEGWEQVRSVETVIPNEVKTFNQGEKIPPPVDKVQAKSGSKLGRKKAKEVNDADPK